MADANGAIGLYWFLRLRFLLNPMSWLTMDLLFYVYLDTLIISTWTL